MKVFGITLLDWEQNTFSWSDDADKAWYRATSNYFRANGIPSPCGCIRINKIWPYKTAWEFNYFGHCFDFLDKLYTGPKSFDTAEDAKIYIDEWLMQIDKLKAFW